MDTNSSESDTVPNKISKFRQRGRCYLSEYLPPDMAIQLELNIYKYTLEYINLYNISNDNIKSIYNTKVQDIYYNLDPTNSPTLLLDILNKKILLEELPYLQFNFLNPTLWEPIIKKKDFIEYKKNNMATSDAYECKKCKMRKCKVFLIQTRSADEPMTIFVQCENCNCSFRIY